MLNCSIRFSVIFVLFFLFACDRPTKRIHLLQEVELKSVKSASACEQVGDSIYIVGDDSPYMYITNQSFHVIDSVLIFKCNKSRIDKAIKPDFESIESVDWRGEKALILFGSGTTKNRQIALVYLISKRRLIALDLKPFFSQLAKDINTTPNEMNCEGIAIRKDNMILLMKSTNTLVTTSWSDFQSYVADSHSRIKLRYCTIQLPSRNQHQLQFTGADFSPNGDLYFTAYSKNGALPHQLYPRSRAIIGKINFSNREACKLDFFIELPNKNAHKIEGISYCRQMKKGLVFTLVSDGETSESRIFKITFSKK